LLLGTEMRDRTPIDLPTYDVLLHVYEAGKAGIQMTNLAREVVISKSGLTAQVDRLERQVFLRRIPDPNDRRAIRIVITDEGLATFRAAAKVHMAGIQRYFGDHLTDDDATVLAQVLERVHRSLEEA